MSDRRSIRTNRLRSTLALCVLVATPAATCGITLGALHLQVQTIEANTFVVIDSNGQILGPYDDGDLMLAVDGFLPIRVYIRDDGLPSSGRDPEFESTDCSGTPYRELSGARLESELVGSPAIGWFAAISNTEPRMVTIRSLYNSTWGCVAQGAGYPRLEYELGRVEGLDLEAFVPPFRVVSLGQYFSGEAGQ